MEKIKIILSNLASRKTLYNQDKPVAGCVFAPSPLYKDSNPHLVPIPVIRTILCVTTRIPIIRGIS